MLCPENTKEKFKLVFTSKWWAVAAGDYYALERTEESGNRHVGWSFIPRIQPWSSIQSAIPGRNVPTLNAVVTSGMSSARGETGGWD